MAQKPLVNEVDEWRDPQGNTVQLCAIEELRPNSVESERAITVIGGISVCREHFEMVKQSLLEGQPMTAIVMKALAGEV